jgi:hypothetical protein
MAHTYSELTVDAARVLCLEIARGAGDQQRRIDA